MKNNRIGKKLLAVALIAIIVLAMQENSVFAESLQLENHPDVAETEQLDEWTEITEEQPENQTETLERESVSQNDISEEEEDQDETVGEQSVSQNDILEEEEEEQEETVAEQADTESKLTASVLTPDRLKDFTVPGMNPPGVTVNLFDYSQGIARDGSSEVAHDYYYNWSSNYAPVVGSDPYVTTYDLGISKNHLLRFGYRGDEENDYCILKTPDNIELGDYGDWNEYHATRRSGIVQKILYNGFPRLNLLQETNYGRYNDDKNRADYLIGGKTSESLDYLFLPYSTSYKECYSDVQGLFQQGEEDYYYYNSQENFASFNKFTNSFTLYNSPGVAKEKNNTVYCGQFFPFNNVTDVFDDIYTDIDGKEKLTYRNIDINDDRGDDETKENNYDPIKYEGKSYIKCYAPDLNHYLGLTLEMWFVQPMGGLVTSDTNKSSEMIFKFSGDDDVWIFIDDVLVADLGGLHDALKLEINFATGVVTVAGETHTLYQSFVDAYGEASIPDGIRFSEGNGSTFADNTIHTLKMFYLERGHMASNLSLSFNIQTIPYKPVRDIPSEDTDENEEPASDQAQENMSEAEESIISVSDNHMMLDSTGIPQTGDDSLIGWWGVLCIVSLIGVGATVCNLTIRKRKQKNHSSKQ